MAGEVFSVPEVSESEGAHTANSGGHAERSRCPSSARLGDSTKSTHCALESAYQTFKK